MQTCHTLDLRLISLRLLNYMLLYRRCGVDAHYVVVYVGVVGVAVVSVVVYCLGAVVVVCAGCVLVGVWLVL